MQLNTKDEETCDIVMARMAYRLANFITNKADETIKRDRKQHPHPRSQRETLRASLPSDKLLFQYPRDFLPLVSSQCLSNGDLDSLPPAIFTNMHAAFQQTFKGSEKLVHQCNRFQPRETGEMIVGLGIVELFYGEETGGCEDAVEIPVGEHKGSSLLGGGFDVE